MEIIMTTCDKCRKDNLDWIKNKGKWELYELDTGDLHSLTCSFIKDEYHTRNLHKVPKNLVCPHGILKTHACDMCDNARRGNTI